MSTADLVGWVATAVFIASYFCARADALRRVQMAGALLWAVFGVLTHSAPVITANILLIVVAFWTVRRPARPVPPGAASS